MSKRKGKFVVGYSNLSAFYCRYVGRKPAPPFFEAFTTIESAKECLAKRLDGASIFKIVPVRSGGK